MIWCGFQVENCNIPEARPGCYLIVHIPSQKKYVGMSFNLLVRLKEHAAGRGGALKLERAIKKYGAEEFKAIPLFYSTKDRKFLLNIEGKLITEFDSVKNGYNIIEKSEENSYGVEFSLSIAEAWKKEETRKKRESTYQNPNWKARRSKKSKEVLASQEWRAAQSARGKARYLNPENRKKTSEQVSKALATPEAKAKHAETSRRNRARPEVQLKYRLYWEKKKCEQQNATMISVMDTEFTDTKTNVATFMGITEE